MKKFLATFLAFAMVLSMLCLPAVAAETEVDTLAELQSAISSAAEGDIVKLTADITVTVDSETTFPLLGNLSGITLDGQDHTITLDLSALDSTAGAGDGTISFTGSNAIVFDKVAGTVKNLTIDGAKVVAGTSASNVSIFAKSHGAVTLDNVHVVNASITTNKDGATNIGGFFPRNTQDAGAIYLNGCSFDGDFVQGVKYTTSATSEVSVGHVFGGFFGAFDKTGTTLKMVDCVSNGTFAYGQGANKNKDTIMVGGMVGKLTVATTSPAANEDPTFMMVNCINNADISAAHSANVAEAGGLIGNLGGNNVGGASFVNCVNTGDITGDGHSGGAFGRISSMSASKEIYVLGFTNSGAITGVVGAGGVIGTSQAAGTVRIHNSANVGAVSTTTSGRYAGGILGLHRNTVAKLIDITGCVNLGNIKVAIANDARYAGGIVGSISKEASVLETNTEEPPVATAVNAVVTDLILKNNINFGTITSTSKQETPDEGDPYTVSSHSAAIIGLVVAKNNPTITGNLNFGTSTDNKLTSDIHVDDTTTVEEVTTYKTKLFTIADENCKNAVAGSTYVMNTALLSATFGARVRLDTEVDEAGIRFDIATNKDALNALINAGYNTMNKGRPGMTFGVGVLKAETAANGGTPLTGADFITASGCMPEAVMTMGNMHAFIKDNNTFSAAVNEITDYEQDYVCVGVLTITSTTGAYTFYTEYNTTDNVRNVAEVAGAALDDTDPAAQAAYEKYEATLKVFAGRS